MVTSEQVAKAAGVSRTTVSRVLSGSGRISAEVRQRVYDAIIALGYEPDVMAQTLARQRSQMIALNLFPRAQGSSISQLGEPKYYFYLGVIKNIEQAIARAGYDLIQPLRPQINNTAEQYVRGLRTRRIAGAILIALNLADADVQALVGSDIPAVFIDTLAQGSHATYVKADNLHGSSQVMQHLLSLGHRRIALLPGGTSVASGSERLLGAQQALHEAGIALDPGLIRESGWNTGDAYKAALELLAERRDFTAIVAGSDLMAVGILRALREHGLRVPEDVSLTGFDDIDLAEYTDPPLTTVHSDQAAMGQGAVQKLLQFIEGPDDTSPLVIPTHLVIRQSTGPVRS